MVSRIKRRKRQHNKTIAKIQTNNPDSRDISHIHELLHNGYVQKAKKLCKPLYEAEPDNPDWALCYSFILWEDGAHQDAIVILQQTHSLYPGNIAILENLVMTYKKLQNWEKATHYQKKIVTLSEPSHSVYHNLGLFLFNNGKLIKAKKALHKALEYDTSYIETYVTLASVLTIAGQFEQAEKHLHTALSIDPSFPAALWNMSILQMCCLGNWNSSLKDYEKGFAMGKRKPARKFSAPMWDGKTSLKGKRLLIWGEQGIGDEIRFCAHLNDFIDLPDKCIIECEQRLVSALSRTYPQADVGQTIDSRENKTFDRMRTDIDLHVPMGTLRYYSYLKHGKMELPGRYIQPDQNRARYWKEQIDKCGTGLKVGFCWRTHQLTPIRAIQYGSIEDWYPLLKMPGVTFINLQYDQCDDELAKAKQNTGVTIHQMEGINLKDDIDESFALCEALDLVITAPTATCEIAAAIGKPTWRVEGKGPDIPPRFAHHPFDQNSVLRMDKYALCSWQKTVEQVALHLEQYTKGQRINAGPYIYKVE